MGVMNVVLEKITYYGRRGLRDYVRLRDQDEGDLFYNDEGEPREWTTTSGARRWMRSTAKRVRGLAFRVTNLKGKVSLIGITEKELFVQEHLDEFGSHEWRKMNAVTRSDRAGMYDVWGCRLCDTEVKRYGLAGRPSGGVCSENRREGTSDD